MTNITSQNEQIKNYLLQGKSLTPIDALYMFGCFRLGARCWDLKHKENIPIKTEMIVLNNGKRIAKYSIVRE